MLERFFLFNFWVFLNLSQNDYIFPFMLPIENASDHIIVSQCNIISAVFTFHIKSLRDSPFKNAYLPKWITPIHFDTYVRKSIMFKTYIFLFVFKSLHFYHSLIYGCVTRIIISFVFYHCSVVNTLVDCVDFVYTLRRNMQTVVYWRNCNPINMKYFCICYRNTLFTPEIQ